MKVNTILQRVKINLVIDKNNGKSIGKNNIKIKKEIT